MIKEIPLNEYHSPSTNYNIREISSLDLDIIVALYKEVFENFSSKEVQ